MQEVYTLTRAAKAIGVTPRIFVSWLTDAGIIARKGDKATGEDARAQYVTRAQVVMLAAAHGRVLPDDVSLAALAGQMQALSSEVDALKRRIAVLEQRGGTREGETISRPLQLHPGAFSAQEPTTPPPVRNLVAKWLARHGAVENTVRRWPDLPLDPEQALLFTREKLQELGYRAHGVQLAPCEHPECVCHQILTPAEG